MTSTSIASTRLRDFAAGAALGACLLLAGCVEPVGSALPECDASYEPDVVTGPGDVTGRLETVSIECYRVVAEKRLEVGVVMPPGPDCYAVNLVDVVENDDAVSLEVRIGPLVSPLAGACPPEVQVWGILVELNGPAEGRQILDAAQASG